jgi:hypothetical protein
MSTGPSSGRGIFSIGAKAPVEIRLACALMVGGALLFVLVDLLLLALQRDSRDGPLLVPLLQLVIALGTAGGLLRGIRSARLFGLFFVLLAALFHFLIVLQPLPIWVRVVSGVIAASQVYVGVLLNTKPALQHSGGARR